MKRQNLSLEQTRLPIMQETGRELKRLLGLRSTRNQQLQEILLSDPAATIAVYRELEKTKPGAHEQVGDVAHAVAMIGVDPFMRVLNSLPEVEPAKNPGQAGPAKAYSQAAHAAFYAGALSDHRGMTTGQEVPTAALLQNPAILALWQSEPESAERATNAVRDGVPPAVAFQGELGAPLEDVNLRLGKAWSLPRLARQAMGDWDDFDPRPQMVKLADGLAQTTAAGWHHEDTATFAALLSEFLEVSDDEATGWLHRQAGEAARALSRYDYPLPGFELILMPGEIEEDDDENIPLLGVKKPKPEEPPTRPAPDLHATMADVMRRIREQAGASRVMFAMLNKDRSRLRTRLALGGNADDGIRKLDLDLSEKTLFSALMGKSQSVWLNRDNARKYQPYLPANLRTLLGPEGAYMMSVFIGDNPLGLLYGDGRNLNDQGYRQFRELCLEATAALGGERAPQRRQA